MFTDDNPQPQPHNTSPLQPLEDTLKTPTGTCSISTAYNSDIQEDSPSNSNRRGGQNETGDGDSLAKKAASAKIKFKKQKQRLSNMCYKHEDIACGKEVTSNNKPRIMKLSMELERQINNQVKDYTNIEGMMRELLRILEQKRDNDPHSKRENDLHLFRQSKCIPSLMDFCKKVLSLYRNEFKESFKLLEIVYRILQLFCTMGCNRQYMILTNRVPTLTSLLTTLIKKEEVSDSYFLANLYSLITSLLDHKLEGEYGCLIEETVEYIHQCSIVKKTISLMESLVQEGCLTSQHLVKSSLRFLVSVFWHTDQLAQSRPIDQISCSQLSANCTSNIEAVISFLNQFILFVIPDKQTRERAFLDGDLPVCTISLLLLMVQSMYNCCKLSLASVQRLISDQFLSMVSYIIRYSREFCEQSEDLRQLLNRVIILVGYLAFENEELQTRLNQHEIISGLSNLPTKFVMDKKSIQVLVPTLCCLIFRNQINTNCLFQGLSAMHVKKFLKREIQVQCNEQKIIGSTPGFLTRKSSLSSMTSANTQCSGVVCHDKNKSMCSLRIRFPVKYWKDLYEAVDPLE